MNALFAKLPRVILLCVVLYLISWNARDKQPVDQIEKTVVAVNIPNDSVRKYFPRFTEIVEINEVTYHVLQGTEIIGELIVSSPIADNVIGYAGKTPLFLAVSNDDTILGLSLLENNETPSFIRRLERRDFFKSWNNKTLEEASQLNVEAVSGATMSSDAIIENVERALNHYLEKENEIKKIDYISLLKIICGCLILLLALLSMFKGGKMKKWRIPLQVGSILILGFWSGYFLSIDLMYNWLMNGIPLTGRIVLPIMALFAVIFPLFISKAYYCSYVCPYGAAQELMGKIKKKKYVPKGGFKNVLKYTRITYFLIVMGLLLWGVNMNLTSLEPFSAFLISAASKWVIALAVTFLIISIFLPRAWCNYFCLTGEFLEILRRTPQSTMGVRKKVWREWVALLIFMVILYFVLHS